MSESHERISAHVSIADAACRARIVDVLRRQGWAVTEQPSGFHLLQAIADVIEGKCAALPGLIVVDAIARGCSGLTIASGLRELGVRIPLVLVARPGDPIPESDDPATRVAGPHNAVAAVAEIARESHASSPMRVLDGDRRDTTAS
jgi:hypothetical protein